MPFASDDTRSASCSGSKLSQSSIATRPFSVAAAPQFAAQRFCWSSSNPDGDDAPRPGCRRSINSTVAAWSALSTTPVKSESLLICASWNQFTPLKMTGTPGNSVSRWRRRKSVGVVGRHDGGQPGRAVFVGEEAVEVLEVPRRSDACVHVSNMELHRVPVRRIAARTPAIWPSVQSMP